MFPPGHLTFFAPRTLEPLLNRAGFEIERLVADGRLSDDPDPRVAGLAGLVGVGNVMTVSARRIQAPKSRPRARADAARFHPEPPSGPARPR